MGKGKNQGGKGKQQPKPGGYQQFPPPLPVPQQPTFKGGSKGKQPMVKNCASNDPMVCDQACPLGKVHCCDVPVVTLGHACEAKSHNRVPTIRAAAALQSR